MEFLGSIQCPRVVGIERFDLDVYHITRENNFLNDSKKSDISDIIIIQFLFTRSRLIVL